MLFLIDFSAAKTSDSKDDKSIRLKCTAGSVIVDSVRIKPLASDKSSETKPPAKSGASVSAGSGQSDALPPVGSTWKGSFSGAKTFPIGRASTTAVQGHSMVLKIFTDGHPHAWRFAVRGQDVTLESVFPLPGSEDGRYSNINVTGSLIAGHLHVEGDWVYEGPGLGHGAARKISLDLVKD